MKPEMLLEQLETTAENLSVKVSYESLASSFGAGFGHGGLCRVKGEYRVIIDKRATAQERVATLATALASIVTPEQLDATTMSKRVREALIYYSTSKAS